jgi:2,3-dihydroxy-2,3-dihydrophenylpropionate dehydrogenase
MSDVKGSVAFLTGGGSGLGLAIVERFVEEGARIVVLDRSDERIRSLEQKYGREIVGVTGDVTSLEDNRRAVAHAVERFGRLDTFIGNAGIWDGNATVAALPENTQSVFDEVMSINVLGYILGAKASLDALKVHRGSIILTISTAGFYPDGGGILYTAAKHACVGLVRQMAFEMAPLVRVNGVAPGYIPSQITGPAALGLDQPMTAGSPEFVSALVPLAMAPKAEDYAGLYVMLASRRDAAPITGTIINSDGGVGVRGIARLSGGG